MCLFSEKYPNTESDFYNTLDMFLNGDGQRFNTDIVFRNDKIWVRKIQLHCNFCVGSSDIFYLEKLAPHNLKQLQRYTHWFQVVSSRTDDEYLNEPWRIVKIL